MKYKLIQIAFANLAFVLFSCQEKSGVGNLIDYEAEKKFYNLYIIDEYENNEYFLDDKHSKCVILVKNQVFVDNQFFGSFKNVNKAVKFARTNNKKDVDEITTISIKKENGEYQDLWKFSNSIGIEVDTECDGCYSVYDIQITVDEAYFKFKNKHRCGLKIIFKESDNGDGFRMFILNFVKDGNEWKLAFKEKIDTHLTEENHYVIDSTTSFETDEKFPRNITLSDLLDFKN